MADRKVSRVVGEVRPLRLRHQEALIRRELRRLVECSSSPRGEGDPGTLRRRRSPLGSRGGARAEM
jgi:hypothetical protein